jgi:hypothetical protein
MNSTTALSCLLIWTYFMLISFDIKNALLFIVILVPSLLCCSFYYAKLNYFKRHVSATLLAPTYFAGFVMAPVTGAVQFLLAWAVNSIFASPKNHGARGTGTSFSFASMRLYLTPKQTLSDDSLSQQGLSTIELCLLLVAVSFFLAGGVEELLKYLVVQLRQDASRYKCDQVRLFVVPDPSIPDTLRRKNPIKMLTLYVSTALGYALFENMTFLCFFGNASSIFDASTNGTLMAGTPLIGFSLMHSLHAAARRTILSNGVHVLACTLTALSVSQRDFYGGYLMFNRGKGVVGTFHILMPAILLHGAFDALSFFFSPNVARLYTLEVRESNMRLLCMLFQLVLLVCAFARAERLYKKLNIWALSDAVQATEEKLETPLVSLV